MQYIFRMFDFGRAFSRALGEAVPNGNAATSLAPIMAVTLVMVRKRTPQERCRAGPTFRAGDGGS